MDVGYFLPCPARLTKNQERGRKVSQSVLQLWGITCSLAQGFHEDSTEGTSNTAKSRERRVNIDERFPPHSQVKQQSGKTFDLSLQRA